MGGVIHGLQSALVRLRSALALEAASRYGDATLGQDNCARLWRVGPKLK
jgi:hypothetical protein